MMPRMKWRRRHGGGRDMSVGTAWLMVMSIVLGWSNVGAAQNLDKVKAGLELWKGSGCSDCNGAFANGEKDRDEAPTGANLRTSRLDTAALKRMISCGSVGA